MPQKLIVVMDHGSQNAIARLRPTELISFLWQAFDGDEKPASIGHPLWDSVGQHFADGQIHVQTVTNPAIEANPAGRAGSPLPAEGMWRDVRSAINARRSGGQGTARPTFHARRAGDCPHYLPRAAGRGLPTLPSTRGGQGTAHTTFHARRAGDCPPYQPRLRRSGFISRGARWDRVRGFQ